MSISIGALLREIVKTYPIPIALALVVWVPHETTRGILFSFHGGVGWLLLALSFPWLVVRMILLVNRSPVELRPQRRKWALVLALAYVPLSILCAYSLTLALHEPLHHPPDLLRWFYI